MEPATRRLPFWIMPLIAAVMHLAAAAESSAQLGALVSPGRLHKAHASLEGVSNCLQCHSKGRQVAAEKCLACHKPVAQRIAAKKGVHRNVAGDCVSCHVEHAGPDAELRPFDQAKFDHGRDAGFPLDGLHAPLGSKCASCHKSRSFLNAPSTCAACHADPHAGSLGAQCASCHSTAVKFAAAIKSFDHSRAAFPLAGAHTRVACESCHRNKQYKGMAFKTCSSCHTDPHQSKLGPVCTSCHTEAGWRTTKVDHARTAFPLRAKHAAVDCAKCHLKSAALVKPRFDTCAACHADPHRGTFKQDCGACHTESGFQKAPFDHATTAFVLTDKHLGLSCVACHKTSRPAANDFRGLRATCVACHTDVHRGELGLSCEKCHTAKTFEVKTFTHARIGPFFAGQHASLSCAQCHSATMQPARTAADAPAMRVGFTTTPTSCVSCHKDVHAGQFRAPCESCHSVEIPKFGTPTFSHAATRFPLTGKHAPLACEACHKGQPKQLTGLSSECAACHQDPHRAQLGQACQTCHTVQTFAVTRYTHQNAPALREFFVGRHASATCAACHKPLPARPSESKPVAAYKLSAACTTCHTDVHRGQLGSDCKSCHKP